VSFCDTKGYVCSVTQPENISDRPITIGPPIKVHRRRKGRNMNIIGNTNSQICWRGSGGI